MTVRLPPPGQERWIERYPEEGDLKEMLKDELFLREDGSKVLCNTHPDKNKV